MIGDNNIANPAVGDAVAKLVVGDNDVITKLIDRDDGIASLIHD